MRILFVHEVDWTTKPVFEMHEFPERLRARGHSVTFHDFREESPGWPRLVRRCVTGRTLRDSEIELISFRAPLRGLAGRLFAAIASWWIAASLVRRETVDAVVLYGVPTNGWAVCWWGRRRGIPVVYRAIDASHLLRDTALAPLVRVAERYVVRNASHVSTHNPALAEYVQRLATRPIRTSVLVPGFDLGPPSSGEARAQMRRRFDIPDGTHVILYRGTLYRFSGVAELTVLLAPFLRCRRDVVFLIVGEGEERANLEALVQRELLTTSVRISDFVPHSSLRALFEIAAVSVNPFQSTKVTDCALPSRVIQSLWCGTPCVSTPLVGLLRTMPPSELLRYVNLGPAFAAEVDRIINAVDVAHPDGLEAARVQHHFAWHDVTVGLESLLGEHIAVARRRATAE